MIAEHLPGNGGRGYHYEGRPSQTRVEGGGEDHRDLPEGVERSTPRGQLSDQDPTIGSHPLDHPIESLAGGSSEAGRLSPPEETAVILRS